MNKLTIRDAQRLGAPHPFALLVTADAEGKSNIMAISWWTYASNNPPVLLVCLGSKSYSRQLIEAGGEFTLCMADGAIRDAAFACGTCSGRDVNKAEKFAVPLTASAVVKPPYVRDSRIVLECRVTGQTEAGNHQVFVADILAVHGDESKTQLYAFENYARLDPLTAP